VLARLRNRRFFSLAELNAAIRELIADLNGRPMRHLGVSRRALFEALERPALLPLPASRMSTRSGGAAVPASITTSRCTGISTACRIG